jgi:hypothetical protein
MKKLPLLLALMMAGALPTFAQVNVITQHNDIARTGQNLSETVLTPANVNDTHFGLLHKIALDDQCYANPLVYSGLTIGGVVHNVVYMATVNNSVYALDATTGAQLWHVNFGTAKTESCVNITGKSGIISTPVINAANSCIYVVSITSGAYGDGAGVLNFRLHKLDLVTGNEDAGSPVLITGTSFVPGNENQRPALLDVNGKIYIGFGSHCDWTPSNGRIFAFDDGTLTKVAEFDNSVPGGSAYLDSIWQAGQGPAADASGNVYYITGNGTWDGVNNFGESIMKLSPTLGLSSYFTANDYANLNNNDQDVGSAGCMVMPGTGYIVGGGKSGKVYVLNPASLGGLSANDANAIQVLQSTFPPAGDTGHIHGAPAYFANSTGPAIYVWGENDHGRCYQYVNGRFNTTASSVTTAVLPESNGPGMAGGNFSISANGTTNGIAWAYGVLSGDANSVTAGTVPGVLFAFDANNLATQLWSSNDFPSRDSMGNLAKFSYPVIANGLVYVSDFGTTYSGSGGLCIYGPLTSGGGTATTPCLTAANSNIEGMVTDGTTFPNTSGFDGQGWAYSASLLGSSVTWNGLAISLLPANANNGASNETITLPAGQFTTLSLLGSGMGGGQTNQTITVHYTDGTTSVFTQSFSDWGTPANYAGESTVMTMVHRNKFDGTMQNAPYYLYGYSLVLNSSKTVSSLVLPANRLVAIVAAALSGQISGGTGTTVNLSSSFNIAGIYTDGTTFSATGGMDAGGHAYSGTLLGTTQTWNGVNFAIGAANANNTVTSTGQVINLPATAATSLAMLATGINGNQVGQTFTVTYTDNTTSVFTQSVSDWFTPQNYAGESVAVSMAYRDLSGGTTDPRTFDLYGYSFTLNRAKTVKSITLPNNANVKVVAVTLIPVASTNALAASAANIEGMVTDGTTFAANGGFDGQGWAYSATLLGSSLNWNSLTFNFLPANANNGASNETVALPAGNFSTLSLLGSGLGGNQANQTVTVKYTDGTTSVFTQSFSDWGTNSNNAGESVAATLAHRNHFDGTTQNGTFYVYGYTFVINSAKTVSSLVLPANRLVAIVAAALSGGSGPALLPTQNATVRSGAYANTNFNGATTLRVKNDAPDNTRHVYLTFDTSSEATVSSAVINLYVVGTGSTASRTITVYQQPTTSWLESTITWNNASAAGTLIGSFNVSTAVGVWYAFDVTSYVQAQRTAGHNIVSVELIQNTGDVNGLVDFASREATVGQPILSIAP